MTMTVRPVRRREQAPQEIDPKVKKKPDMDVEAPTMKEMEPEEPEILDHTHPEYDKMMVMMQQIQSDVSAMKQSIGADGMNGEYEDDDEEYQEQLTGVPDKEADDRSKKDTKSIGPEGTSPIPKGKKQTDTGDAPGDDDNKHDKFANEPAKDAAKDVGKPKKEYPKKPVKKNRLRRRKNRLKRREEIDNRSKRQKEDPSEQQPGATEDNPKPMEGASKQQMEEPEEEEKPIISSQQVGDEDEYAGVELDDEKKPKLTTELIVQREYERMKKQLAAQERARRKEIDTFSEDLTRRRTVVGRAGRKEETGVSEDVLTARKNTDSTVQEYLQKAQHTDALRIMQRH